MFSACLSEIVSRSNGVQYIHFSAEKGEILVSVPEAPPAPQSIGRGVVPIDRCSAPAGRGECRMKPVQ